MDLPPLERVREVERKTSNVQHNLAQIIKSISSLTSQIGGYLRKEASTKRKKYSICNSAQTEHNSLYQFWIQNSKKGGKGNWPEGHTETLNLRRGSILFNFLTWKTEINRKLSLQIWVHILHNENKLPRRKAEK